ncbi:MAG: hypothetical protein HYS59_01155 [Candidatus Vogelbacteria bacterium]|nr:hypothetical protein [Candidatus Vogelbacteria bacterium]
MVLLIPPKDAAKYSEAIDEGLGRTHVKEVINVSNARGIFQQLFYFFYSHLIYTGTTRLLATIALRADEPPAGGRVYLAPIKWCIANIFGRIPFMKSRIVPWTFLHAYPDRPFKDSFEKYKPDLVFASHLYGWFDQHLLAEARRRGTRTMGMPAGWDHLDKYYLPFHVDTLLVQSEEMREQATLHQGYEPRVIHTIGYPHFSFMQDKDLVMSRNETLSMLGFPMDARYVLYVSGSSYCPDEPEIIERMLAWGEQGAFGKSFRVVIRPYPGGRSKDREFDEKKYNQFKNHPLAGVFVQQLWVDVPSSASFVNVMRHADAVVSVYTTVALEAVALDVPVIAAGFDGDSKRPFARSVRRFEIMEHFQRVFKIGAMSVSRSFDDLKRDIETYLRNRNHLSAERERMREYMCGPIGSDMPKKVAKLITRYIIEAPCN